MSCNRHTSLNQFIEHARPGCSYVCFERAKFYMEIVWMCVPGKYWYNVIDITVTPWQYNDKINLKDREGQRVWQKQFWGWQVWRWRTAKIKKKLKNIKMRESQRKFNNEKVVHDVGKWCSSALLWMEMKAWETRIVVCWHLGNTNNQNWIYLQTPRQLDYLLLIFVGLWAPRLCALHAPQ